MAIHSLTVIGLGFMGSSVAAAARQRAKIFQINGIEPNDSYREIALQTGLVDQTAKEITRQTARVDLIVACAPVDHIAGLLVTASELCSSTTLLTDVGSTKAEIVRAVEGHLPTGHLFVGSHPLAGSEKQGPEFANPDLFAGRLVVLTPTGRADPSATDQLVTFWQSLGAKTRQMAPEDHDRGVAFTSHLPHLLSSLLAAALPPEYRELTATGFQDVTRLARGCPDLWTAIFGQNRGPLLEAIDQIKEALTQMETALKDGEPDRIAAILRRARNQANDEKRPESD